MLAFGVAEAARAPAPAATPIAAARPTGSASGAAMSAAAKASVTTSANAAAVSVVSAQQSAAAKPAAGDGDWQRMVAQMNLQGMVRALAVHCALTGRQANKVQLSLDREGEHFRTAALEEKLTQALSTYLGEPVRLEITVAAEAMDTPARQAKAAAEDRMQNARDSIETDPNIRAMRDIFGATVQPDSIRPAE
jgi:DNA polymerase III subunit gamma/tau